MGKSHLKSIAIDRLAQNDVVIMSSFRDLVDIKRTRRQDIGQADTVVEINEWVDRKGLGIGFYSFRQSWVQHGERGFVSEPFKAELASSDEPKTHPR